MFNAGSIQKGLEKILRKLYGGNGLYIELDSVNLRYDITDSFEDPYVEVTIKYGRDDKDNENNFSKEILVTTDLDELENEVQFFLGRCYQEMCIE